MTWFKIGMSCLLMGAAIAIGRNVSVVTINGPADSPTPLTSDELYSRWQAAREKFRSTPESKELNKEVIDGLMALAANDDLPIGSAIASRLSNGIVWTLIGHRFESAGRLVGHWDAFVEGHEGNHADAVGLFQEQLMECIRHAVGIDPPEGVEA